MRALLTTALGLAVLLVHAGDAHARTWKGMVPGKTSRQEVVQKFGKPNRELKEQGSCAVLLGYTEDEKISGARQAQFCIGANGKLEHIIVFPDVTLDKDTVQEAFGEDYKKKLTDDFIVYWFYERDGLVIFFDKEGKQVTAVQYLETKAGK